MLFIWVLIVESGICALCRKPKGLEKSHIIPNSAFRVIKRWNSGKVITIKDDKESWIEYSNESWWEYLLCSTCEDIIEKYETYSLGLLNSKSRGAILTHNYGITLKNINYPNFKLFLTSILWRASVSKQDVFSKVILHPNWEDEARLSILHGISLAPLKLGCKISKLNDPEQEDSFCEKSLKQIVISPIPRIKKNVISFLFVFLGYMFEFFAPAIPYKESKIRGVCKKGSVFFCHTNRLRKYQNFLKS